MLLLLTSRDCLTLNIRNYNRGDSRTSHISELRHNFRHRRENEVPDGAGNVKKRLPEKFIAVDRVTGQTYCVKCKISPVYIRTLEKRAVRVLDIAHTPQYVASLYVNRAVFFALPFSLFFFNFYLLYFSLFFSSKTELSSVICQSFIIAVRDGMNFDLPTI